MNRRNIICLMLKENFKIGTNLEETADNLFKNVSAIDEITSTIANTTQKAMVFTIFKF